MRRRGAMNASMTRARFSVQMWSLRKPRLSQEFVRSATQRAPACDAVPFVLITKAFRADHEVAAETGEKFTGLAGVVTGVQVHGDLLKAARSRTGRGSPASGRVTANRCGSPRTRQSGRGRLRDPDGVARRVAERAVARAPGLVDGLLEDLRAGCAHSLEGRVDVVGAEHEHRQDALGEELL